MENFENEVDELQVDDKPGPQGGKRKLKSDPHGGKRKLKPDLPKDQQIMGSMPTCLKENQVAQDRTSVAPLLTDLLTISKPLEELDSPCYMYWDADDSSEITMMLDLDGAVHVRRYPHCKGGRSILRYSGRDGRLLLSTGGMEQSDDMLSALNKALHLAKNCETGNFDPALLKLERKATGLKWHMDLSCCGGGGGGSPADGARPAGDSSSEASSEAGSEAGSDSSSTEDLNSDTGSEAGNSNGDSGDGGGDNARPGSQRRPDRGRNLSGLSSMGEKTLGEAIHERTRLGELSDKKLKDNAAFTPQEWKSFGINDLHIDDFVQVGESYFKPVADGDKWVLCYSRDMPRGEKCIVGAFKSGMELRRTGDCLDSYRFLIDRRDDLYSNTLSIDRVFAHRCLEGMSYNVPISGVSADGLAQFISSQVCKAVDETIRADATAATEVAGADTTGANSTSSQEPSLSTFDTLSKMLPEAQLLEMKMKLPQLRQLSYFHDLKMDNANAPDIHNNNLCLPGGEQFAQIVSLSDRMQSSYLFIRFDLAGKLFEDNVSRQCLLRLKRDEDNRRMLWNIRLKREGAESFESDFNRVAPRSATKHVFDPSAWLYRGLLKCREEHGNPEQADGIDPLDVARVSCIAAPNTKHWADMLRIESGRRFKTLPFPKKNGDTGYQLWHCSQDNNIWCIDNGDKAFHELLKRTVKNVCHLADDTETFEKLVDYARSLGRVPESTSAEDLHDTCMQYSDWVGQKSIRETHSAAIDQFKRDVMDSELKTDFDVSVQINFINGRCYDVMQREMRRIEIDDMATMSTQYAYAPWEESLQQKLVNMLIEIHSDPKVAEWRISRKAKCLTGLQADPCVLFSFGEAGAGKGTEVNLTVKAFGDYGKKIDEQLLRTKPNSPEGPTSARMQLKGLLYAWTDEAKSPDPGIVKDWTGGSEIKARQMHGKQEEFPARFNQLEVLFNDMIKIKKDPGMERRVVGVKFENMFVDLGGEAEAEEKEAEWRKECEDGGAPRYAMYPQKYAGWMSLAPQLMTRMIRVHQQSTAPGGKWMERPQRVQDWTDEVWAGAAPTNILEAPMNEWYVRCACRAEDPDDDTNLNLVASDKKPCTHKLLGSQLMDRLKKKLDDDAGASLYKLVKGRSRSDAPIYALLKRVKMQGIMKLMVKDQCGSDHNVIFGITPPIFGMPKGQPSFCFRTNVGD